MMLLMNLGLPHLRPSGSVCTMTLRLLRSNQTAVLLPQFWQHSGSSLVYAAKVRACSKTKTKTSGGREVEFGG